MSFPVDPGREYSCEGLDAWRGDVLSCYADVGGVCNWAEYKVALIQSGSFTLWLDEAVIARWYNAEKSRQWEGVEHLLGSGNRSPESGLIPALRYKTRPLKAHTSNKKYNNYLDNYCASRPGTVETGQWLPQIALMS